MMINFMANTASDNFLQSGQPRELEGPGQIYVVTASIEYLTVLLEYINLLGAISRVGPRAKCPSCSPLSVALPTIYP